MSASPVPVAASDRSAPDQGGPGRNPVADAVSSISRTLLVETRGLDAIRAALPHGLGESFSRAADAIASANGCVVVTGMGKSGHVGRKLAATLASTGTPSHFLHPAEASHGDLGVIRDHDVVLAISWSGETPELADIVEHTRRLGVPLLALTAKPMSALGQAADIGLFLPEVEEACPNGLAPTTSTTMQLAAGDALAILLLERQGFTATDFNRFHPGGKLGTKLLPVHRLMHTGDQLPLVPDTAMLSEGIVEMTSKRFGVVGVTGPDATLVGILTDGDVRRAFRRGFVDQPVREVMGVHPCAVEPNVLASAALAQMNRLRITSIFVVQHGIPLGLIHIHDLIQARVV